MNEEAALEKLEGILQDTASPGIHPGLARLDALLADVGLPQKKFRAVHIVGTNGKGSTAAHLYSIMREAGYKTALYTSPHLVKFTERLEVNGEPVPVETWLDAAEKMRGIIKNTPRFLRDAPTYFELITAAAIMILADARPDAAIFEAGMGGRLDASNVLQNIVLSLITPIGMDHTEYLGDTLEKIAEEKFAIARGGVPALFAGDEALDANFIAAAKLRGASPYIFSSMYEVKRVKCTLSGSDFVLEDKSGGSDAFFHTPLVGTFQPENAALAAAAARLLVGEYPKITERAIAEGIKNTRWSGRMEIIEKSRPVIIDGGHNPHAMRRVAETIKAIAGNRRVAVVAAMMKDKDINGALSYFKGLNAALYCTEVPGVERSQKAYETKRLAEELRLDTAGSFEDPMEAIKVAMKEKIPVFCCGSLFLVGYIKERQNEIGRI